MSSPWLDARPPGIVSLVTTVDGHGRGNASPKVWWMPTSYEPPLVLLSLKPESDTARNIAETALFVLHIPSGGDLLDTTKKVLDTAKPLPHGDNELDDVGIEWEWLEHDKLERPLPYVSQWPWFCCWVTTMHETGDHVLVTAQVGLAGGFSPAEYDGRRIESFEKVLHDEQWYDGGVGEVLMHRGRNVFNVVMQGNEFSVPPYVYPEGEA